MVTVIILIGIAALILYRYQQGFARGYSKVGRAVAPIKSRLLPVPQAYRDVLEKYFFYYRQLEESGRNQFAQKVCNFIYGKRFIPRNLDDVPLEARVLIAATAVQLTFGLNNVYLRHFKKILIYPNDYYSSITKRYHKGEVNPRFGIIVISWQSFVEGFINPSDSINLGLHEMAHALRLENVIRNEEYQFFDEALIKEFDEHARNICRNENQSDNIFRAYACVDEHEFFAVAVENFFERASKFKSSMPNLYTILSKLLNQDPTKMPYPRLS
jgi:Mlc titration factor MtfA (ptsG expression regulator)